MADKFYVKNGKGEYRELDRAKALKEIAQSLYYDCVEVDSVGACNSCPLNRMCIEESTLLDYANNELKVRAFGWFANGILNDVDREFGNE